MKPKSPSMVPCQRENSAKSDKGRGFRQTSLQ
jgi:hypothetical protein